MQTLQNGAGDAVIQAKMDGLALEDKKQLGKKLMKKPPPKVSIILDFYKLHI